MEFKEMTLEEVKEKIYFVTAQPEKNKEMKEWVMEPEDCFGKHFDPEGEFCRDCTAASRIAGIENEWMVWNPLREWCRQLCERDEEEEGKPKSTLQSKLEQLKALRERKE